MGRIRIPVETSRGFGRWYEILHIQALSIVPDT